MQILESLNNNGNKIFIVGNILFNTYEAAKAYLEQHVPSRISQEISELVKAKDKNLDLERQ
jgi:hypothetical protein